MLDPVVRALANAPYDDEPVSEEEARDIAAARAALARGEGHPQRGSPAPSSACPPKISSAWDARLSNPNRTTPDSEHGPQEDRLDATRPRPSSAPSTSPPPCAFCMPSPTLLATGEGDVKRLQDIEPPEFRLRVGDYRVRFHDHGDTLHVTAVKHRREVYR